MIDLTPLDVRKKKEDFRRAVRGYDSLQVDAFLDVVADRLEQLVREHGSLADKVGHLESSLKTYQDREHALNEALLAAQELREEARSQAERDASVRLREAETHAEAILLDADQAIRHSQRRLEDLRMRRGQYLKSLRTLLERFEDYLELEETRLEAEPEDMGDILERLESDLGEASPPTGPTGPAASEAPMEVPRNGDTPQSLAEGGSSGASAPTPESTSRITPSQVTPVEPGGPNTSST